MADDNLIQRSAYEAAKFREQAAKLSLDIERQLASRSGPLFYILACAHSEATQAFIELSNADPSDAKKIMQLQLHIDFYSRMQVWLSNAVSQGRQAYQELENRDALVEEWVSEFLSDNEA